MASRMEKYCDSAETSNKRVAKNESLYKRMYEDETYSNIEGVVTTPKSNEIDIQKIREVLLRREEAENSKNQLVKRDVEVEIPDMAFMEDEEKNYDIMDVLKQAKKENTDLRENKYRRLDDEYLQDLKHPVKKVERVPIEEDIKEIKDLLNTLTSSKELKKLRDTDLSLDMFSDLKSNTGTLNSEDPIIKAIINEAKEIEEKNNRFKDLDNDIDKTFDTTNMKLKTKDYVSKIEDLDKDKERNPILTGFIIFLFIVLAILIVYVFYRFLK